MSIGRKQLLGFGFTCTLLLGSTIASLANAGKGYQIECEDAQGRKTQHRVSIGGGMDFSMVTGFCRSSKEYVSFSWSNNEAAPISSGSGEDQRVTVPTCPEPIKPIKSMNELTYCPQDSGEVRGVHLKIRYD